MAEILYNLAVVMDKYDCVHLLRPWINDWLPPVVRRALGIETAVDLPHIISHRSIRPEPMVNYERLTWVAWVFGDRELFTWSSKMLLDYSGINPNRDIISTPAELSFQETLEAPGLKGNVL